MVCIRCGLVLVDTIDDDADVISWDLVQIWWHITDVGIDHHEVCIVLEKTNAVKHLED